MKKILLSLLTLVLTVALLAVGAISCASHVLERVAPTDATCLNAGNIEYWKCTDCQKLFSDSEGKTEVSEQDVVIAQKAHEISFVENAAPTCEEEGVLEHYACSTCDGVFSDAKGQTEISASDIVIEKLPHQIEKNAGVLAKGHEKGVAEHWQCTVCEGLFLDEEGEESVTQSQLVTAAPYTLVDFVVEVPVGKDPVVLQLTDTQSIYGEYKRPGREGVLDDWTRENRYKFCFDYITEVINAVKPDLIIITGDIIYGEFDDTGIALLDFVEYMETFDIPWAPIFGNHENESKMGVDWQCEQFEKAENCLFKQRELTGNGNYSVGISQDGYITRTFYMLDSNGCAYASTESLVNGHTKTTAGFGKDQIAWYTDAITELKKSAPNVNISFAYHIPNAAFAQAYRKYGFGSQNAEKKPINIDTHPDRVEGDFGQIISNFTSEWDANNKVHNGLVELGVDSIFIGHEHCLSASVVHEGIRFQFGQKSSQFDRFSMIVPGGKLYGAYYLISGSKPIIGGSVIPLDEKGEIVNPYIYYCGDVFGTNPTV